MNNREIKFRAWDKNQKYWVTNSTTISAECRIFLMGVDDNNKFHCFDKTKDVIIQQYTGLKDKNGRNIYEGDIVSVRNYRFHIARREVELLDSEVMEVKWLSCGKWNIARDDISFPELL